MLPSQAVHVVNLWATWCGPCKAEMPDFKAMFARKAETWSDAVKFVPVQLKDNTDPRKSYQDFAERHATRRRQAGRPQLRREVRQGARGRAGAPAVPRQPARHLRPRLQPPRALGQVRAADRGRLRGPQEAPRPAARRAERRLARRVVQEAVARQRPLRGQGEHGRPPQPRGLRRAREARPRRRDPGPPARRDPRRRLSSRPVSRRRRPLLPPQGRPRHPQGREAPGPQDLRQRRLRARPRREQPDLLPGLPLRRPAGLQARRQRPPHLPGQGS
ncbi:TlpA family protein disulfide reductase [Nannocystis pusilla]|uniref:TlpA family protein disulfide reductase n=1 Tax=Nannocystis pusilla TaxID=889268 RepID=UPI003DA3FC1F